MGIVPLYVPCGTIDGVDMDKLELDNLNLLFKLHCQTPRQGPGSDAATLQALSFCNLSPERSYMVADIGCGCGSPTLALAQNMHGTITAVDFSQDFLQELERRMQQAELKAQIKTLCCSMDNLPFAEGYFDLIWSEGAIYNMGLRKGVQYLAKFLKDDGLLAFTDMSWFAQQRPQELTSYWASEYPDIGTISSNIAILEALGFKVVAHFCLPDECWTTNYYAPLFKTYHALWNLDPQQRTDHNKPENHEQTVAQALLDKDLQERDFYLKYREHYGYVFYIAQKVKDCS